MKGTPLALRLQPMARLFDNLVDAILVRLANYGRQTIPDNTEGQKYILTTDDDEIKLISALSEESYVDLKVDPLYASAAAYLRSTIPELITDVTQEEKDFAEKMRSHFLKKFTWKALKGQCTVWQSLALQMVTDRGKILHDKMGILIKLPFFYEEDVLHEHLKTNYNFLSQNSNKVVELSLVKIAKYWHGSLKIDHIWLADSDKNLYCLPIDSKNSARTCIIAAIESRKHSPIKLRADLKDSRIKELQYSLLINYQFEE